MAVSILHNGLESPEALWRRNLRADSLRLGEELHGRDARRPDFDVQRIAAGILRPHEARHFRRVEERASLRAELPKSFRNGFMLAQARPIFEITNFNTGTTYATLVDAIYLASTGDEIILPAGCGAAHLGSFTRYSHWSMLNSYGAGYSGSGSATMIFGNPSMNSNPSRYAAAYLSIVGIPSSNNLSSVSWTSTGGGQLRIVISDLPVTTYRRGMNVRLSGCTNNGTGGAAAVNTTFPVFSVSGGTLILTAPASGGVFGTIGGSPVLNNDRAQISAPVGYLTATLNPGDTTIQLDDASDFNPSGSAFYAWGNGDGTWQAVQMVATGVSGNNLTGVGSGNLPSPVPVGTPIMGGCGAPAGKALFTPAATNPTGITMSNLEIWGAASFPSGGGIFQWTADPGTNQGSLTLNNVYMHDCMMCIRPGSASLDSGVFLDVFDSEFFRGGLVGGDKNHTIYIDYDVFTFRNSIAWLPNGPYLIKSRCPTNYILYSRTYGDHGSAANTFGIWTSNFDFPNGGLVYIVGSTLQASEQDNGHIIRYQEETGDYPMGGIANAGFNGASGTSNPTAEIYLVNDSIWGPANGTGYSGARSFANNAVFAVGAPGMANPEIPSVTSDGAGSLSARSYWLCTTLIDSSGNESLPSCMLGSDSGASLSAQSAITANHVAVLASPTPRTGAVNYNVYAAHSDPAIWWNSGGTQPPETGPNQFFYDSAFTLPVSVVNAGGSQPASFVIVGVTYVFPEGESVNFALSGMSLFGSAAPQATSGALIAIPANNLLTIKSPPAMAGATGWYPYVNVASYNGGGNYLFQRCPLSPQVLTPIAIGTDWVQTGAFIQQQTFTYNFYRQNASPIAIGTDWTEPTTGLTNLNPSRLRWLRRAGFEGGSGFARWYAVATKAYTNYVVRMYDNVQLGAYYLQQIVAAVTVWSGAATPYPFDAEYPSSILFNGASTTATTAAGATAILASFRNGATAGASWTQAASLSFLMSEYRIVAPPQTGLAVTQIGGGSTDILVDALVQTGTLAVRGAPQTFDGNANAVQWTIPTVAIGDVLVIDVAVGNGPYILAIDPPGPPVQNQSIASSPIGLIVNCVAANYNPTGAGIGISSGGWVSQFPGEVLPPTYPTIDLHNLLVNTWNGSTFDAPFYGAVWNDATNFDFTLKAGSLATNAGTTIPGTGHAGDPVIGNLAPTYQTSMVGPPTPGELIRPLTTRTDGGLSLGAFQYQHIDTPLETAPPVRLGPWFKFGWNWKFGVATVGAMLIVNNPKISRRKLFRLRGKND